MDCGVLLHLCTPATWRMALAAGSLAPPSLLHEGFVHLSTPRQVAWPANALHTGRTDRGAFPAPLRAGARCVGGGGRAVPTRSGWAFHRADRAAPARGHRRTGTPV